MKLQWTPHFLRAYRKAPKEIQAAFDKQSLLFLRTSAIRLFAPKSTTKPKTVWQARVTKDWRFYFRIEGTTYVLQDITRHPK